MVPMTSIRVPRMRDNRLRRSVRASQICDNRPVSVKCELDLCNLRGQGYDGAIVMSGKVHPDSANPASCFVSPLLRSCFEFSFVILPGSARY